MKTKSFFLLEVGVGLLLVMAPLAFGLAYLWGSMAACAFIFFLLILHPEIILSFKQLSNFFKLGVIIIFLFLIYQTFHASLNPFMTRLKLIEWAALFLLFFFVLNLSTQSLERLFLALLFVGGIEVFYGAWQVFSRAETVLGHPKLDYHGFLTGTYFNRNHFAGFMELCLGLNLGFVGAAFYQKKWLRFSLLFILFLILFAGLLMSGSRMGIVSFILSFSILSLFLAFRLPVKKRIILILPWASLGGIIFLFSSKILNRLSDTRDLYDSGLGRLHAWQDSLGMIRDYPLGIGLGSFKWVYPQYQSEFSLTGWFHAHNDYLELIATLGLPIFIFLAVLFVTYSWGLFRKALRFEGENSLIVGGVVMSLLSLLIHGFGDFNFAMFGNMLIFVFLWASLARLVQLKFEGFHE